MEKFYGVKALIVFALCLLFFLSSCSSQRLVFDSGEEFYVEIAATPEEQRVGLMFRESLPQDEGMLFIFDEESEKVFWMKNTLIPLDMVFFDSNWTVVEVKRGVLPCKDDPCERYKSLPARYVLEVNSGAASGLRNGVRARLV